MPVEQEKWVKKVLGQEWLIHSTVSQKHTNCKADIVILTYIQYIPKRHRDWSVLYQLICSSMEDTQILHMHLTLKIEGSYIKQQHYCLTHTQNTLEILSSTYNLLPDFRAAIFPFLYYMSKSLWNG